MSKSHLVELWLHKQAVKGTALLINVINGR